METEAKNENFIRKEESPCVLIIKNINAETKKVEAFSDINKDNGITIGEIKGSISNLNGTTICLMRMQTSSLMKLLFNGFWINGKKYMYINWFSKFQYQSTILDLPINISKDTDKLDLQIPEESDCIFTFFPNSEYPNTEKYDLPKYHLSVIATNKTGKEIDVNLLDKKYFPNGFEDDDLKIEIATCYLDDNEYIETKSISCFTLNVSQLTQIVTLDDGKYIITQDGFHRNQYQSCMIDFEYDKKVKIGDTFAFPLLPNSKVMYSFNESKLWMSKE